MARDPELDRLQAIKRDANERRKAARQKYDDARDRAQFAYDQMQAAWEEQTVARDEMNREFHTRKAAFERNDAIWSEYKQIRERNNYHIDYLKSSADAEHQAMVDCFEAASSAYENGDRASAKMYSSEGHDHKDRRNDLNREVHTLVQEILDAKARAESMTSKVDSSAFHAARSRFKATKERHQAAHANFKRAKTERDHAKAEFERLQEEFSRAKEAYQARKQEVKAARKNQTVRVIAT